MSRHGKFADNSVQVSFVSDRDTKAALQEMAEAEKRTLSNFLRVELERIVAERRAVGALDKLVTESKSYRGAKCRFTSGHWRHSFRAEAAWARVM